MHFYKCFFSIIVICIDHCKRLVYHTFAASYCLTGSPRFCAVCRFFKSFREIIQRLEYIFHITDFLDTVSDHFSEIFLDIFTDDKHDFIKSCFQCIMNGIINNNLAIRPNRSQLFHTTAESGANACRHNNQCCIHTVISFLKSSNCFFLYLTEL